MSDAMLARKREAAPAPRAKAAASGASGGLRIGAPDDSFEREADRVADAVMAGRIARRDWSFSKVGVGTPLQRKCACGGPGGVDGQCEECKMAGTLQRRAADLATPSTVPPIVHEVLRSPGEPLDSDTREFFESRFGHDFGQVRVHTGDLSARSASAVSARAYTVGRDVVFGKGQYQPATSSGRKLLSHELAHVIQQRPVSNPAGSSLSVEKPGSPTEVAADRAIQATRKEGSSMPESLVRGVLTHSGPVGAPILQRLSYSEVKEDAYKGMIALARKANDAYLNLLRKAAGQLPAALRGVAEDIIGVIDVINGALISVVLAVIGIVVGFAEGVVDLVRGLVGMITGVAKILFDLVMGIFTNFDAAKQDLNAVADALKGLYPGVKALISDWLDRFQKAPSERQSLMIGELTGQVLAMIATWAVAAGRAGTAAKIASEGGEAAGGAAATTDAAAAGVRAARPALRVIEGGGGAGAGTAGTTASAAPAVGNAALKIAPEVEQAPRFVPRLVPAAVEAAAKAPAAAAGAGRAVGAATGVAAAKAAQISEDAKKKEPCGPLPILWPSLLPLPSLVRDLKRTGKEERESEGVERGDNQVKFRDCLNDARHRSHPIDPSEHCKEFGAWFDPNLTAGAPADAHHMHPLYLGGDDGIYNLGALDPKDHLSGHARLDDQRSMMETPEWQACKPISPALKNHPVNQEYQIEGRK